MDKVIKRDGTLVEFDVSKIEMAINKANSEVARKDRATSEDIQFIVNYINGLNRTRMKVEDIQDIIEDQLIVLGKGNLAKEYYHYRYKKELLRRDNTTDSALKELMEGTSEYWNTENSNKDAKTVTVQRDYFAGITSTDYTSRVLLPKDIVKAHNDGLIHFHDADYFAQNALHNCDLINLEDMLQNGTMINGVMIEKPHKLLTAMTIATQIITAVASSQYGGCTITLTHLAPFVRDSYNFYLKKYRKRNISDADCEEFAKADLDEEIKAAVQTFNYQVNSMSTTNGQAPFLSVGMYLNETDEYKEELALLIEEFLNQRILGMKNEKGVYITPAFPKLIYVLEEDNIKEDGKYYYLTKLAAKCTAKRLVPDYVSEKVMLQLKVNSDGSSSCYPPMGCRSFLTPDRFSWKKGNIAKAKNFDRVISSKTIEIKDMDNISTSDDLWQYLSDNAEIIKDNKIYPKDIKIKVGKQFKPIDYLEKIDDKVTIHYHNPIFFSRFNQGVVTISLPDVALSSKKDLKKFWKILDERLELCHRALRCRHERLLNRPSDMAPIL